MKTGLEVVSLAIVAVICFTGGFYTIPHPSPVTLTDVSTTTSPITIISSFTKSTTSTSTSILTSTSVATDTISSVSTTTSVSSITYTLTGSTNTTDNVASDYTFVVFNWTSKPTASENDTLTLWVQVGNTIVFTATLGSSENDSTTTTVNALYSGEAISLYSGYLSGCVNSAQWTTVYVERQGNIIAANSYTCFSAPYGTWAYYTIP